MSACEECWTEANHQVMLFGGSVVERYRKLITESPDEHTPEPFALAKTSVNSRLE